MQSRPFERSNLNARPTRGWKPFIKRIVFERRDAPFSNLLITPSLGAPCWWSNGGTESAIAYKNGHW